MNILNRVRRYCKARGVAPLTLHESLAVTNEFLDWVESQGHDRENFEDLVWVSAFLKTDEGSGGFQVQFRGFPKHREKQSATINRLEGNIPADLALRMREAKTALMLARQQARQGSDFIEASGFKFAPVEWRWGNKR